MSATAYLCIAAGVFVGILAVRMGGPPRSRYPGAEGRPTALGRRVLALGVAAFVLGFAAPAARALLNLAILAGVATVVAGVGALVKGPPRWPTWTGLALAVVPSLPLPMLGLGYVLLAAGGCGGHLGDLASELAPPPGIEVQLQTDGMGACWAETPADVSEAKLVAHYQREFRAHGWQVLPPPPEGVLISGEVAINGTVAEKDGILFGVVVPNGTTGFRFYFLDVGTHG